MIRYVLSSVAGMGLLFGAWAIAGENCQKGATAKADRGGCGKVAVSAEAQKALSENASYQRANELIKAWPEVPAKLVAMTEEDKGALSAAGQKMADHPSAAIIKPSVEFVKTTLHTAVSIDAAGREMCAAQSKAKADATVAAGGEAPKVCPKVAAAKLRMEQSAALVAKASQLITVATKTTSQCNSKGEGAQASAGADEGCPHAKAAALAAKSGSAELVAAKADGEKSCSKSLAAKADGDKPCTKSLSAKAESLISESGRMLAQWQEAEVTLASMDGDSRTALEAACSNMLSKCPAGRLMPETLSTARDLLVEASKLSAQCQAECAKNKKMEVSEDMKNLMKSRCLLISAAINVLDRTCTMAKPTKQLASAQ